MLHTPYPMDSIAEKHQRLLRTSLYSPLQAGRFTFGGRTFAAGEIVDVLGPYLTDDRAARIEAVLSGRTYSLAPVVEGLVNLGNVSAVMRSAEALGCQPFHVVTGDASFKNSSRTSQGAEKWLDVHLWQRAVDCAAYLRREGYRIVVTHLDDRSVPLEEIDFSQKIALVFGNERDGVSREMRELADDRVVIPMVGFVQSFNISVAAAVTLYHAFRERRRMLGSHGDLTDEEKAELRAAFYLRSVRSAAAILEKRAAERATGERAQGDPSEI